MELSSVEAQFHSRGAIGNSPTSHPLQPLRSNTLTKNNVLARQVSIEKYPKILVGCRFQQQRKCQSPPRSTPLLRSCLRKKKSPNNTNPTATKKKVRFDLRDNSLLQFADSNRKRSNKTPLKDRNQNSCGEVPINLKPTLKPISSAVKPTNSIALERSLSPMRCSSPVMNNRNPQSNLQNSHPIRYPHPEMQASSSFKFVVQELKEYQLNSLIHVVR